MAVSDWVTYDYSGQELRVSSNSTYRWVMPTGSTIRFREGASPISYGSFIGETDDPEPEVDEYAID